MLEHMRFFQDQCAGSLLTHKILVQLTCEISKHQKLFEVWDLLFCHESSTSHRIDALLAISSRSWPMLCASTKPSQHLASSATQLVMRESRPGCRGRGSLEDHREHRDPMDLTTVSGSTICSCDGFGT